MSKRPHLGKLPKTHKPLSSAEEKGERLLHQVEDENRRFYESNLEIARNISLLQSGVSEKAARALTAGIVGPGGSSALVSRLKEEKVQSELYRAVQGNEIYETEFGEDSQNYEGSENAQYLNANRPGKFGRQFRRVSRGAGSMVGTNNFVEAALDRRFGRDRNVENRRLFVANRMTDYFNDMFATRLANFEHIRDMLGLFPGAAVADVINAFAETNLNEVRAIGDWCRNIVVPPGVPEELPEEDAFNDLMLLLDAEARQDNRIGIEGVNDFQGLREFYDTMISAGGAQATMMRLNEQTVDNNSLFPLEKNSEGRIFLADLRSKFNNRLADEIRADALLPPPVPPAPPRDPSTNAANFILAELNDIRNNELEEATQTKANTDLINEVNRLTGELRQNRQKLVASFDSLDALAKAIAAGNNLITGPPPLPALTGGPLNAARTGLSNLMNTQTTSVTEHLNLEREYLGLIRNLRDRLRAIPNGSAMPALITDVLGSPAVPATLTTPEIPAVPPMGISLNNNLRTPLPAPPFPADYRLYAHLQGIGGDIAFGDMLDNQVPGDFMRLLTNRVRLTPFLLLQRYLRRDYLRTRGLKANVFSEEANKYAALKAGLRLEEVENMDIARSASNKAAEFLEKGLLRRGKDNLQMKLAGVQNFIGLEPFNIRTMSADSLVEQIVNSHADFHVFRGVNKFTTVRDLRVILNASGTKVAPAVVERFVQTLADAVSQYKAVLPNLNGELDAGDWDIENLVIVLQKFRKEIWINHHLERLNATGSTGNMEHEFIRMLREGRAEEKRISAEIHADVVHPDAMWRKLLFKDELKKVLDKDDLDGTNKLKEAGIANRKKEIARMQSRANSLPDGNAEKQKLQVEIADQNRSIETIDRQIADAKDLYERVEDAKKYIAENKLSRTQKKEYLAQTGLTQIFYKMGTNFRLQRWWAATKRGAKWTGGKIKQGWSWNRRKWLNAETAKSVGKKTFSVLRIAATPITTPLGWAWKAGTFPLRLTGRALLGTARVPGRLWRMMSKSAQRNYLREKRMIIGEKFQNIANKQARLQLRMSKVPYSWDRRRIMRQMNKLEEDKVILNEEMSGLAKTAEKSKIAFDSIGFSPVAANDNAVKAQTAAPAEAPKSTIKKAA